MPTSGPLLETLFGAGGGLGAGLALGWWYFRRGATEGAPIVDDDEGEVPATAAEYDGVLQRLDDLQRSHARCLDELAERDRLVAVLRQQAAGLAARLADVSAPGDRWR
jgi:hypothetical protein